MQAAVDQLAAAGVTVHGELINATEHDILGHHPAAGGRTTPPTSSSSGYQHHRESTVAEHVIRRHPKCSVLLARPPQPA